MMPNPTSNQACAQSEEPSSHPLIVFFSGLELESSSNAAQGLSISRNFLSPPEPTSLQTIISWPDSQLEACHEFIQLLFPLPEPSDYNPNAPLVDATVFHAFRHSAQLRRQLRLGFTRILSFYGFRFAEASATASEDADSASGFDLVIEHAPNFPQKSKCWLRPANHHHLRITRILRCLRVLGLEAEAQAWYAALLDVAHGSSISRRSILFWTRAATRPLWITPDVADGQEVLEEGKEFLREGTEIQVMPSGVQDKGAS
ncbi:MAG: hypothetical protein M1829_004464 [Trizodia sp. TS-e1964]|nr:MAG: hypothetical protein M1829_004464 [Trizodia sp. TS-e1964]